MLALQILRDAPMLLASLMAAGALGLLFVRHASAAAWALVAVFVTTLAIVPPIELQVTHSGLTLYALDLVTGLMFGIGIVRLFMRPVPWMISLPITALAILFMIHVAWGIAVFGLQAAVNSSRLWLYVLGPLVFAVEAQPRWTRKSFTPLIVGAGALAVFALFQIARNGLYGANEYIDVRGQFVDARPVTAAGALVIVQCILVAASARLVRSTPWFLAIASMGAAVMLLQYRTVWIVALLSATIAYVRWARVAIVVNERAAAAAAAAILFVAPLVLTIVAGSSAFEQSVRSATGQRSTLSWRTQSWTSLVEAHSSTEDLVLGLPTGTSLKRRVGDQIATQSAHSLYVESLLTFGIVGPFLVVWPWILIIRRRRNVAAALGVSAVTVVLLIISQALFGITNTLGPLQGLLLGMLLQAVWLTGRENVGTQFGSAPRSVRASLVR